MPLEHHQRVAGAAKVVAALAGEQFALAEAVERLRRVRRTAPADEWLVLSAADPLNLNGVAEPGKRVAAIGSRRILYRDGVAVAALTGTGLEWLTRLTPAEQYRAQELLRRGRGSGPGGRAVGRHAEVSGSV